ncbi:flagellar basal body rod protein FlgB [Zoogloea dura]|jgi:flagellar basal-body rod protein FlgB|uniref:flagellar basal body rod protein FlgB n=1 Tax=Zoogloea dura TaxID=2728840 RepID=UPI001F2F4663|nr:flagellar basal body rod protein FlgB [Zoogloea dura]
MPPVTGIGSPGPLQPSSDAGHSAHTSSGSGTTSFAAALSQVMGRTPGTVLSGTPSPASSADGAQNSAHRDAWPSLGDGFQRRHIPLVGSGHPSHDFQQLALGLRAYRQQIIASNIANADTPGYKAVDIDFQEALRNAQAAANVPPVSLTTTSGGHLSGQSTGTQPPIPLKYHVPSQGSIDGNTVEMDVERAKFAENTVMHQFAMDRVSGHFKHEIEMLQSLK